MTTDLLPSVILPEALPALRIEHLPQLIQTGGGAAHYAWDEYYFGHIRNHHTRKAYEQAVRRFMNWANPQVNHLTAAIEVGVKGPYTGDQD